jgi:putative hydrolase of HD superfamily
MPCVPAQLQEEFAYYLGLYNGVKDEFLDKINETHIEIIENDLSAYNYNEYNAIDGKALKQCDKLSAFIEASLSISHGIKSKELINGKKQIIKTLKTIQEVDFQALANEIDDFFGTTGQTQTTMEF